MYKKVYVSREDSTVISAEHDIAYDFVSFEVTDPNKDVLADFQKNFPEYSGVKYEEMWQIPYSDQKEIVSWFFSGNWVEETIPEEEMTVEDFLMDAAWDNYVNDLAHSSPSHGWGL